MGFRDPWQGWWGLGFGVEACLGAAREARVV